MIERREIELIPKELKETKKRSKLIRSTRLVGFGLLGISVLACVIGASVIGSQKVIAGRIQKQIAEKETRIAELNTIEEKLVLFAHKNSGLARIFGDRRYYSTLLDALKKSIPAGVTVTALATSSASNVVGLSGEINTYTELAAFMRDIIDPEKGGSLFTEISLTSVSFDPTTGLAQFVAEATMISDGLKKGWEAFPD